MSNPFAGTLPAIIPFSANCDANGNATIKLRPRAAFWWTGKMVAKVGAGVPAWEVSMGGIFAGTSDGQRAEVAGLIVAPGDTIQIQIIGASANTSVSGSLIGTQGATMKDVAQVFSPSPNTITLESKSPILLSDRIDTAAGTSSKSYPMPSGAQTIVLQVDQANASRNVGPTQLLVRCFPSDFIAVQIGGAAINLNTQALGLLNPIDTSFDVEWTMVGANPLNTFVDVAVLGQQVAKPQNIPFQFFGANNNLGVTEESANPASWQAANLTTAIGIGGVPAGTTTTVIPGAAGLTTRLYRVRLGVVASAGSSITIECPTGTVRAQIDASRTQDFDGDFGKVACGVNAALAYVVHGANASVSGGFGSVNQS